MSVTFDLTGRVSSLTSSTLGWPEVSGNSTSSRYRNAVSLIQADVVRHKSLLNSSSDGPVESRPLVYIRTQQTSKSSSANSANSNRSILSDRHYDEAAQQLSDLRSEIDEDGDPIVEDGAINTALSLLNRFRRADYAPPLMSWHGGDAVVMLWTVGNDTLAITITNGEMGYIVRRNFKQIERHDSINPEAYRLEGLR
jgi:hypothetical protein